MPHKHKRKADHDESNFNLPPTVQAAPLPVGKVKNAPRPKKRKVSHVDGYGADDTPKAFARLMQFKQGKPRNGLDNGPRSQKQKKAANAANSNAKAQQQQQSQQSQAQAQAQAAKADTADAAPNGEDQKVPALKIMPGESLADFRQRVNQALPLSGVSRSARKVDGVKVSDHRVTKHERHLKRLQAGWRKEEARIRDKEMEAAELAEEENDELDAMWEDKTDDLPGPGGKKKGKKGKRKMVVGEVKPQEEDEWEALRKKREERKGLHDVVQAPPTFDRVPREIFKVKGGAKVNVGNVPNAAGSLMKREQLAEERQGIIETYRRMMAAKRDGVPLQ